MPIDFDPYIPQFKTAPMAHQRVGTQLLVDHEHFGLFDEMRLGKTKQAIDAACILRDLGVIDTVLVVAPASVRGVWLDPDPNLGELAKHAWFPGWAVEFHRRGMHPVHSWGDPDESALVWIVTNYEFIRSKEHREHLLDALAGKRFLMILDESSFIKNRRAAQTKACTEIGKHACRRVILTGTPMDNPGDLWSQLRFLSPAILPYHNFFAFRARHAVMGGWQGKQVVRWINLEELQAQVAPYVIRRERKDCFDLPAKIPTQVEVPLVQANWDLYRQMRDEAITWVDEHPSMAAQAGVKVMRLAQIASGLLGGIESGKGNEPDTEVIGAEKIDWLRDWVRERIAESPKFKVVVWCRFRKQLERVRTALSPLLPTLALWGGQPHAERELARARFALGDSTGPALLAGQPQAGGYGLSLAAADTVVYLSNDFRLETRLQSEDRTQSLEKKTGVLYVDVLATGPRGQKTIDHATVAALRRKDDLARWTIDAWKRVLAEEVNA